jgi:hypothetical protein
MSIYAFCEGCKSKVYEYDDVGKLVNHTCPARYNPFDEDIVFDEEKKELVKVSKCFRHDKFMQMEKQKRESAAAKKG